MTENVKDILEIFDQHESGCSCDACIMGRKWHKDLEQQTKARELKEAGKV